jgi:hypothetical protein
MRKLRHQSSATGKPKPSRSRAARIAVRLLAIVSRLPLSKSFTVDRPTLAAFALVFALPLLKSEGGPHTGNGQKAKARRGRRSWRQSERARRKLILNKAAAVCVFCENERRRQGPTPDAACESGQALEKAENDNGWLLEKVGIDLGLAPHPFGVGATSAWGWRRAGLGLAPRRFVIEESGAKGPLARGGSAQPLEKSRSGQGNPKVFL